MPGFIREKVGQFEPSGLAQPVRDKLVRNRQTRRQHERAFAKAADDLIDAEPTRIAEFATNMDRLYSKRRYRLGLTQEALVKHDCVPL